MIDVGPPRPEELPEVEAVLSQTFDIPGDAWARFRRRVGDDAIRVARVDGRVRAALGLYRFGQFYGGRVVSSTGVAAVGVAPEARGSGVGSALMAETVRGLHADGIALSCLYPATRKPYRRVGYEVAGSRVDWRLRTSAIGLADRRLPLTAVEPADLARLRPIYTAFAVGESGMADRSETLWERATVPPTGRLYAYLAGEGEGYLTFTQVDAPAPHAVDLQVKDFVALTPAAGRRLWTVLADHHSIAGTVRWSGPAAEPRLALLPEVGGEAAWTEAWMSRIVRVPDSLEARGWPSDGVLDLVVTDPLIAENAGSWRLEVIDGVGRVSRGGTGALRLDVRGLAAIYGGFLTPLRAARAGLIEGDAATLAVAARLFAGPEPWLADRF